MSVNVRFFMPTDGAGGSGPVDPMRILYGGGLRTDDLDSYVLFSALGYQTGVSEEFVFSDPNQPVTTPAWQPSFNTARVYAVPPLVLAVFVSPDGSRHYPSMRVQFGASNYLFIVKYSRNGNGTYNVTITMNSAGGAGSPKPGGVLRIYVLGRT